MIKAISLPVLLCLALGVSGCSLFHGQMSGTALQPDFIAANNREVLIDVNHAADPDLASAHQMAMQKCTLFGKNNAVLEAINPVSGGKERLSFACQ